MSKWPRSVDACPSSVDKVMQKLLLGCAGKAAGLSWRWSADGVGYGVVV